MLLLWLGLIEAQQGRVWPSLLCELGVMSLLAAVGTCDAFSGAAGVPVQDRSLGLLGSEEGLAPVLEVGSVVRLRLRAP